MHAFKDRCHADPENVPRETDSKFHLYLELLTHWQKTINLVSTATLAGAWDRHIQDSSQLLPFMQGCTSVADLGSGGGFPGIVLAILGVKITLIESDIRKAEFLKEVVRTLKLDAKIINGRVEQQDLSAYKIITARAFAPLLKLFEVIQTGLKQNHTLLLLKGKNYQDEIALANKGWVFDYKTTGSVTDSQGVVLHIKNIRKRGKT